MKKISFYIIVYSLTQLSFISNAQVSNNFMNNLIANTLNKNEIPAIVASLITTDSTYYGLGGTTTINGSQKINLNNKFHLGSNSKGITSFIAMKMVENNLIKLDTKFLDVFPNLKFEIKKEYHNITLSDLLSHNAFIQPYTSGLEFKKITFLKGNTANRRYDFSKFVLNQNPVKKGTYSNAGYVIASLMLEKEAGKSFETLLQENLSENGIDFFIGFPNKESDKNPAGHWKVNNQWVTHLPHNPYRLNDYMVAAGDVSMNIVDYSKFIQMNLSGLFDDNFLTKESYQKLHFGVDNYSYGWQNSLIKSTKISSHNGSAGTYYCHTILIPKAKIAVVIMTNSSEEQQIKGIYKLREDILKNIKSIKHEV